MPRETEGQTPRNPPRMNGKWMRQSAPTAAAAVPRSRNRSNAISNGSRSANASGIHATNGCGERCASRYVGGGVSGNNETQVQDAWHNASRSPPRPGRGDGGKRGKVSGRSPPVGHPGGGCVAWRCGAAPFPLAPHPGTLRSFPSQGHDCHRTVASPHVHNRMPAAVCGGAAGATIVPTRKKPLGRWTPGASTGQVSI
jgi:hypothetical protein